MSYKKCKFGRDRSINKGTLLLKKKVPFWLYLGFGIRDFTETFNLLAYATTYVSLVAIIQ